MQRYGRMIGRLISLTSSHRHRASLRGCPSRWPHGWSTTVKGTEVKKLTRNQAEVAEELGKIAAKSFIAIANGDIAASQAYEESYQFAKWIIVGICPTQTVEAMREATVASQRKHLLANGFKETGEGFVTTSQSPLEQMIGQALSEITSVLSCGNSQEASKVIDSLVADGLPDDAANMLREIVSSLFAPTVA